MYDDEHPLEIAIAWMLAGFICGIYILVKLGAGKANIELAKSRLDEAPMHYSPE